MKPAALAVLLLLQQEPPRLQIARGPYLQNVRRDAATICFWTNVECEAQVRIGDKTYPSARAARHSVEVTGLSPATSYAYSVESGGLSMEAANFRTAPAADAPVTFVAFGDSRSGHATHAKVVELIRKQEPAFVLVTGDLVYDGRKSTDWDRFFQIQAPLLRSAPLYPAIGNHERNAPEYFDVFVLPGEERWYSFDWGPVHVASLDTTHSFRRDAKQIAWLKEDLAAAKAPFKLVIWHHPPYSRSFQKGRQTEAEALAATWSPILKEGGVCLALGGHNHNYQRAEADGVCYVTTAGGGAPLYPLGAGVELKASKVAHHVCRLRAEGKKLTLEAIDLDGNVLDTWVYEAR